MTKYLLLLIPLLFAGCKKIEAPTQRAIVERDFWLDAIAVTGQKVTSVSGNTAYFELEVAAMENGFITTAYPFETFGPDTFTGPQILTPVSVQKISKQENASFQTIILYDISYDWLFTDDGAYIDAVNRLQKVTRNSTTQSFGVGFFGRDSEEAPVKFFRNAGGSLFQHTDQEIMKFLAENFSSLLGNASSSSLYDAINKAADELIANPHSIKRSITVLAGRADDGTSSATLTSIIQKCTQNNIQVNMIFQEYWSYNFYRIAYETGGFIVDNNGTKYNWGIKVNTTASALYNVYELLAGNGERYVLSCTATRPANWAPNSLVRGYMTAHYFAETGGEFISSDLDVNQLLPVYFRIP